MIKFAMKLLAAVALSSCLVVSHASPVSSLPWKFGPTKVQVGSQATMDVPEGYAFLDPAGTKRLNELMQNPSESTDTYTLAPVSLKWTAYFEFGGVGYVKDDERIDADNILNSVKAGTQESNKERRSRGWDTLTLVGWNNRPEYDTQFKSLAWSFLVRSDRTQHDIINYNARILGRSGVMNVVVVADPAGLTQSIADFKSVLGGFAFVPGQAYSDFRSGDRVAEYGLAALITGGVAAVAAKKGFFTVIVGFLAAAWKLVLVALAAIGASIKRLFTRKAS